ncbi:uncharacterized protein JCM15063_002703 [Sporobolomyces koalae]|uniref:uncharacterized protein n=1 Tax=Sporobolomyces koalae TaxID=500713 RepID=UPI0031769CC1
MTTNAGQNATTYNSAAVPLRKAESSGFATGLPGGQSSTATGASRAGGSDGYDSHAATGLGSSSSREAHTNQPGHLGSASVTGRDHALNNSLHNASSSNPSVSGSQQGSSPHSGAPRTEHTNSSTSAHSGPTNGTHHEANTKTGPGFSHDATGAHAGVADKIAGSVEKLVGKATKDSRKVVQGETRKHEGKEGVQAAKAEGSL